MLTDHEPVEVKGVDGVLVYADAACSRIFHYASTVPTVSGAGTEAAFSLLRFDPGSDASAGQLSLLVDLAVPDAKLDALRKALEKRAGGPVTLRPITWSSGDFSAAVPGSAPVIGQPSLLGDNVALVSLPLDRAAFILMLEALDAGAQSPLSIVYKLGYESFSPSYGCTVEIDAQNFRDWVSKRCSANFILINFESTDTFASLREAQVIRISATDFDPDGHEDFQRGLLASLRPLFEPLPHFGAAAGPAGGWGIGFSCSQISGTDFAARQASLRFDEATAKPRAIYLQGIVGGLADAYRAKGVVSVPTGGDATFRQRLTVSCYADYAGDGIARVSLAIRRPGETSLAARHDFTLADPGSWPIELTRDPRGGVGLERQMRVFFDSARPDLASGWESIGPTDAFVSLIPRALYAVTRHSVFTGPDFPWGLVSDIVVDIAPPAGSAAAPVRVTLTEAVPAQEVELFVPAPMTVDALSFRAVIVPKSGTEVDLGARAATGAILIEPFERRDVDFLTTGLDWSVFSRVRVSVAAKAGTLPAKRTIINLSEDSPRGRYSGFRLPSASRELSLDLQFIRPDHSSEGRHLNTSERFVKLTFP